MTDDKGTFETVGADHGISVLANTLSDMAYETAARLQLSKWDVCVALANAIGQILADASKPQSGGKPLPRSAALARMNNLKKVMKGAYDLRDIEGEA